MAQRFPPDCFKFDRFFGEIIKKTGWLVSSHLSGAFDLLLWMLRVLGEAEGGGGSHHFFHEGDGFGVQGRIGKNLSGIDSAFGNGQAIKGNIPDKFVPSCRAY